MTDRALTSAVVAFGVFIAIFCAGVWISLIAAGTRSTLRRLHEKLSTKKTSRALAREQRDLAAANGKHVRRAQTPAAETLSAYEQGLDIMPLLLMTEPYDIVGLTPLDAQPRDVIEAVARQVFN